MQTWGGKMSKAIEDVANERLRQKSALGWTEAHDDNHVHGTLAMAAVSYALPSNTPDCAPPKWWPWNERWWKSRDYRTNLVRAGALIIAEIERLDRAAGKSK
jgi:hypothetical protein